MHNISTSPAPKERFFDSLIHILPNGQIVLSWVEIYQQLLFSFYTFCDHFTVLLYDCCCNRFRVYGKSKTRIWVPCVLRPRSWRISFCHSRSVIFLGYHFVIALYLIFTYKSGNNGQLFFPILWVMISGQLLINKRWRGCGQLFQLILFLMVFSSHAFLQKRPCDC